MNRRVLRFVTVLAFACRRAPLSEPGPSAPALEPAAPLASQATTPPPGSSAPPSPPTPAKPSCEAVPLAALGYHVTQQLDAPVSDFAVGEPPRVAARSGETLLLWDGKRFSALPAIEPSASDVHYRLFFGRDNRPRLMGYEGSSELSVFYRRFKGGRFQPEPKELGPLASERGALYGVLGIPDPEVVCKPHEICLIKRLTGWTQVPAHAEPVAIFIGRGDAYAFVGRVLQRLEKDGFNEYASARPFEHPSALWVDEQHLPWVLDGDTLIHATNDAGWHPIEVPLNTPRALAGTAAKELWVVGEGGVAVFDGIQFRCPSELSVPLSGITQADQQWWIWGESGAFLVSPI